MSVDIHWLDAAVTWASAQMSDLPSSRDDALAAIKSADPQAKARGSVYLARAALAQGNTYEVAWRLGNAANGMGGFLKADMQLAAPWLVVAARIFPMLVSDDSKFDSSNRFAHETLAALGISDLDAHDPITQPAREPPPPTVLAASENVVPTTVDVSQINRTDEDSRPKGRRSLPDPDEVVPEEGISEWRASGSGRALASVLPDYRAFVDQTICTAPSVVRYVKVPLDDDFEWLEVNIGPWDFPSKPFELTQRARTTRTWALASDMTDPGLEPIVRRRWLLTGLWNWILWRECKWETNEPQARIDIVGLLESMVICRRYRDLERDFLLEASEATVRIVHTHASELIEHHWIRRWVVNAAGIYLLLAGPEPTPPSRTPYKEREYGLHGREEWARHIAASSESDDKEAAQTAFCLASLANWDRTTLEWLLGIVFGEQGRQGRGPHPATDQWLERAAQFIDLGIGIGIGSNPWESAREAHPIGRSSEEGSITVTNATLRVAAAETTARAPRRATLVTAGPFAGRRVPTYLVYDQYGISGILKLDVASRVQRERHNFRDLARGSLHESHRPSECVTGSVTFPVPSILESVRGIFTSYVFSEDERPATLTQVVQQVPEAALSDVMRSLFSVVLRPWLAHAKRTSLDLRRAYGLLHPTPVDASDRSNRELRRLRSPEICATLGSELTSDSMDFRPIWDGMISKLGMPADSPDLVNPVWLAAQLSDVRGGALAARVFEPPDPLCGYSTLVTTSHGDLHGDNVLCAIRARMVTRIVIIDFEAAHQGHVCEDVSRLEASILVQTFDWTDAELHTVGQMLRESLDAGKPFEPNLSGVGTVGRVATAINALRQAIVGCGQVWWPLKPEEYALGLLSALLPITRYWTEAPRRRASAFYLASVVATWLKQSFDSRQAAMPLL